MEIIERFVAGIDKDRVTVKPFDGYIFLCGGALSSPTGAVDSARQYALTRLDEGGRIAGHRVMIAEKLTSLLHGDDFRDLIEFEEHIAALSACVLIFVESPGSIAELGSFAVMPHLANKLLVVCEQRMDSALAPSFIFLGPVASLRRSRENSVQVFPIFKDESNFADPEKMSECWQFIEESVIESIRRPISEAILNPAELSHRMVVVAALVDIFVALKFSELQEILAKLEVFTVAKQLRRITRMLEQFSLIKKITYGREEFFFSLVNRPLLTVRPNKNSGTSIFDQVRFKADAIDFFEKTDGRRHKAILSFRRGTKV
ncbi:retron St85 family effector protein [Xanthomonas arboricola]|uniref:retron St85 family effector protein n=1 Tax=Xanthomonas arboricola TaxID=56448 RepID=UPI00118903A5|nr:retron St85 family effector protein [Xanthomonas arboricola]QDS14696.1 hypothetical protein FPL04_02865 [Xanthomonas arboricola]